MGGFDTITDAILPIGQAGVEADLAGIFSLALIAVFLCVLISFYGYKIFRFELTLLGALGFGLLGYLVISPFVTDLIGSAIDFEILISAAVGLLMAIIGAVFVNVFYRISLGLLGLLTGYLLGAYLYIWLLVLNPDVTFLRESYVSIIITVLVALIVGVLFFFFFRFIYIILSSFGGMILASMIILGSVTTAVSALYAIPVGVIAGIFAAKRQFANYD